MYYYKNVLQFQDIFHDNGWVLYVEEKGSVDKWIYFAYIFSQQLFIAKSEWRNTKNDIDINKLETISEFGKMVKAFCSI